MSVSEKAQKLTNTLLVNRLLADDHDIQVTAELIQDALSELLEAGRDTLLQWGNPEDVTSQRLAAILSKWEPK